MVIRDAVEEDLAGILAITNERILTTTHEWREEPHTLAERVAWFATRRADGWPVLVAVEDDAVIGWSSFGDFRDTKKWPGYRFVVEHTIQVAEPFWGRGVGRALMTALFERARLLGKRVTVGAIDGTNVESIAFHARLGFIEVARMPAIGEKFGQPLDLVLMQRSVEVSRR